MFHISHAAQHCQYILGRTGITECPRRHTAFGFALLQPCHNMVGDIGEPPTQQRLHNDSRDLTLGQLVIQILCALINVWWKISTHTAAIGGVAGALIAFSIIFMFNPVSWLSFVLILAGMVGSSRMILRQHTLTQVVAGFGVGLASSYSVILFL